MLSRYFYLLILISFIGLWTQPILAQTLQDLMAQANAQGKIRIIVGLAVDFRPEGELAHPRLIQSQRLAIKQQQTTVLERLQNTQTILTAQFNTIPYLGLEVDAAALTQLAAQSEVITVVEDHAVPPAMASSHAVIGTPSVWEKGYTGSGQTIAVLDTGIDKTHPFFSGKVVSEACYSSTVSFLKTTSLCPGQAAESTAPGAGRYCPLHMQGCDHGTHVASIAAGYDVNGDYSGVAKQADIIAIQVFSQENDAQACGKALAPCPLSFASDQMKALERVYELRTTFTIAAVNMSLGGGAFEDFCDFDPRKPLIDTLRSVGIATIIASGNNGFTDNISSPACISTAISVGATDDFDNIADFSNVTHFIDLLAPGVSISAAKVGGGLREDQGTSMAAPHVTGTWAILKQAVPTASIDDLLIILRDTATPIDDDRPGHTVKGMRRLNFDLAMAIMGCTTPCIGLVAGVSPSEIGPVAGTFILVRTGDLSQPLSVAYTLTGTATQDMDYLDKGNSTAKFAAGKATTKITLKTIDDKIYDAEETITATLMAPPGYTASDFNEDTLIIFDDESGCVKPMQVTNPADEGIDTLREKIVQANTCLGLDHIYFEFPEALPQTIALSSTLPTIADDLVIHGPGADQLTLSGNQQARIFEIKLGTKAEIKGLTLAHGQHPIEGGGILNDGQLTVVDSILSNNIAAGEAEGKGGAIKNNATLIVKNSTFHNNSARNQGGAIASSNGTNAQTDVPKVTITNSVFSDNTTERFGGGAIWDNSVKTVINNSFFLNNLAAENGGGIETATMNMTINRCRFFNNIADKGVGGGLSNLGGLMITQSTFDRNQARNGGGLANSNLLPNTRSKLVNNTFSYNVAATGGGIFASDSSQLTLINNTLVGDAANTGSSIHAETDSYLYLQNNIAAGSSVQGALCNGTPTTDSTANFVVDGSCGATYTGDPQLGPFQDNGGPTFTYAPLLCSPVINVGDNTGVPTIDQRGSTRVQKNQVDLGAVESAFSSNSVTITAGITPNETGPIAGTFILTRCGDLSQPLTVNYRLTGSATLQTDYDDINDGSITFAAGVDSLTITLETIADDEVDPGETIIAKLQLPSDNATNVAHEASLTIIDNQLTCVDPIWITQAGDTGPGSLREAIHYANSCPGLNHIQFRLTDAIIPLVSALPVITDAVQIQGPGAQQLAVSGEQTVRLFEIAPAIQVEINALSLRQGQADSGAALLNKGNTVLDNVIIAHNTAKAFGGGILNEGTLKITHSTLSHNMAKEGGGAIANQGLLSLINVTVSTNTTTGYFGGGGILSNGDVTLVHTTLFDNAAMHSNGGGVFNLGYSPLQIKNSIIAQNTGGDCYATWTTQIQNLIADGSCTPVLSGNPKLDVLQNNGGATPTHALLAESPAIDAGDPETCALLSDDQRGEIRPQGEGCDIGAFEYSVLPPTPPDTASTNVSPPETFMLSVNIAGLGKGKVRSDLFGIDCSNLVQTDCIYKSDFLLHCLPPANQACAHPYTPGTWVMLTPTAALGSTFSYWSGDRGCSEHNGQLFIIDDLSCTAHFELLPVTLTVTKNGQGQVHSLPKGITCGERCTYGFEVNEVIELNAIADENWQFQGWQGHCDDVGQVNMTTDKQCQATFVPIASTDTEEVIIPATIEEPITLPTDAASPEDVAEPDMPQQSTVIIVQPTEIIPCPQWKTLDFICNAQGRTVYNLDVLEQGNLSNAVLTGTLTSQGWVSNLLIQPQAQLSGGIVTGYITNQGTMMHFEFRGRAIVGGVLAGDIVNASQVAGYFQDVQLAAHTHISGGFLAGEIRGEAAAPAWLEQLVIQPGSHLSHVKIGKGVKWAQIVSFGEGVQFVETQ